MTAVRKLASAATAAAALTPFALTPAVADASGRRCAGSPEVCFRAYSLPDLTAGNRPGNDGIGTGLDIARVQVYTTSKTRDVPVRAQIFMFRRGEYLHGFKTSYYVLPKVDVAYSNQPVWEGNLRPVNYCDGLLGGTLPNSTFITPCHTWKPGYRMGANFYYPDGRPLAQLVSDDQTLEIKA